MTRTIARARDLIPAVSKTNWLCGVKFVEQRCDGEVFFGVLVVVGAAMEMFVFHKLLAISWPNRMTVRIFF